MLFLHPFLCIKLKRLNGILYKKLKFNMNVPAG